MCQMILGSQRIRNHYVIYQRIFNLSSRTRPPGYWFHGARGIDVLYFAYNCFFLIFIYNVPNIQLKCCTQYDNKNEV